MSTYVCPYCSTTMSVTDATLQRRFVSFENMDETYNFYHYSKLSRSAVKIDIYKCPHCEEYIFLSEGAGDYVLDVKMNIRPISSAKQFPEYVPIAIRQDYKESYAIVQLSPKASATLSRRCLQGMIRDFWGISKSRLIDEIDALQDKIPATQWRVIDGVRRIGNIGAHMEKDINSIIDIEPDEANKLLKLIELLVEQWYINRHEQELLYADILGIDENKQGDQKKK